jgi:hypothetical protein
MATTKQESVKQPTKAEQAALAKAQAKREREQKALAQKIAKLRADKVAWDGDNGICEQVGINSATTGRALLRRYKLVDAAGGILPSYDRDEAKAKREAAEAEAK